MSRLLDGIRAPADVRALSAAQLPTLCAELRHELIAICGRVGGHLGASLGAVELIVALHRTFKSPTDRVVFDVGHQAYAHKLLTGRRERMSTLRQEGGIAPFLDPTESPHDAMGAGHACTAVSVACGMAEAKRLRGEAGRVIAVIGDGALTGGLTFEGLNNAGAMGTPLVIVLNDNQMSISPNVGAMRKLLDGRAAASWFEALGFTYLGPVDGHALGPLCEALGEARRSFRPVVVHVRTQKGRGFVFAEEDDRTRGHAMGPYELRDGKLVRSRGGAATYSDAFARALEHRMAEDTRVVAISPAMLEGSALTGVKARFPDRVFDVGIAEQHAVTFAAGLAAQGMRPVCALYSTFLQRAYDSIIHDVCLPNLPVVFAVDRAGLVGADGATHQGAFDVAGLRPIPNLDIWVPVTGHDVEKMLSAALVAGRPVAIRYPRATTPEERDGLAPLANVGRARWLKRPPAPEVSLIAVGPLALAALEAAHARPSWAVLDASTVVPLDETAVLEAAGARGVVTVEDASVAGGFGSAVLELYARHGVQTPVRCLGLPRHFMRHGDARKQRASLGLSPEGIRAEGDALTAGQSA